MLSQKRSSAARIGWLLAAAICVVCPLAGQGTTPDDGMPVFGMVGIAPGQVARLNAVMGINPEPFHDPVLVTLQFLGADGQPITDQAGDAIARDVLLFPGEAAWLDLKASDVLSRGQNRMQIRAVMGVAPDDSRPVVATLEIFNQLSGRTQVLHVPTAPVSGITPDDNIPPEDGAGGN